MSNNIPSIPWARHTFYCCTLTHKAVISLCLSSRARGTDSEDTLSIFPFCSVVMQSTSSHHWFRTTPLNQLAPVLIYRREQSGIPSVLLLPRREEHLHLRTLLLPGTKTPRRIKWTYTLHLHKIRQGLTEQKLWVYSLELHSFNRKTHRRSYLYWCTVVQRVHRET